MIGLAVRREPGDSWTRTTLLALLLVVLGQLLLASDGHYTPEAIRWLLLASALGLLALTLPPVPALEQLGLCLPIGILLAGLVLQFSQVLTHPPGMYLRPVNGWLPFLSAVGAAAVLAGSLAFAGPGWARVGTALLAVCFLAAGLWVLRASPRPTIDVFVFQQQASDALLPGRRTYEGFAAAWPTTEGGEFGDKMNSMPKYVVSSTLENAGWTGSIFVRGNLATEIGKLKDRPGQDLLLSGSSQLSARGWPGLAALIDAGPAQATARRPASPELPFWSY